MPSSPVQAFFQAFAARLRRVGSWMLQHKRKTIFYFFLAGVSSVLLLILAVRLGMFGKLPSEDSLRHIKNPVATTIYGSNKEVLGSFYIQNRSNVDSAEVNQLLREALIAVEDIRFYEHNGIDYRSLGRVLVKSILLANERSGGGSTITQQLAKNVFGRSERFLLSTPINKIREMFIARRMEKVYTKDEILLLYLNTVMFGENLFGIEKAAHRFFNKKPADLNLEESALMVGLLKAPNAYNPRKNPERAQERRNTVLGQMHKYGKIDEAAYLAAKEAPVELDYQKTEHTASYAAYYKAFLREEFAAWAAENPKPDGSLYDVDIDGLKIYTSIHPDIQQSAEKALPDHMGRLQERFDRDWDVSVEGMDRDSFLRKLMWQDQYAEDLRSRGLSTEEIREKFAASGDRLIWTWDGFKTVPLTFEAYITHELTRLHAGILALDNRTGRIMAYVGGNDYNYSQYDQVQIPRQVGSVFKPIAYLAALQNGLDPCTFYTNERRTYSRYEGWTPRNADGKYSGSYSVWGALANSINTISAEVMLSAGVKRVVNLAERMGIGSELPEVPSLVLGTADITLSEIVASYAYIANGGGAVKPFSILRIEDEYGQLLYEAQYANVSRAEASTELQQLRKMMRAVVTQGTGGSIQAYNIPFNIIGKTGTTQNNADGWFIGSSPEVTVGAWVGTLDKRVHFKSSRLGAGSITALPLVGRVFGDLSLWRSPILSDFTYTVPDFDCVAFSELPPEEARLLRPGQDSLAPADDSLFLELSPVDSLAEPAEPVLPDSTGPGR
ncbi:transglycosylase domain-containing protein [Neolewinella lacunae]|uniref:Transglycosylase domain-containing protein n=1 Tax=Neolewinella lacunae TaxID=1517758 RepID=A0A923PPN0_9BACT|nr:transglycosylase domain-containing protein [Neolewinella lacunae]MBC6996561.1 transglycosylase domain-containing protein [Neolewinella lacunae]MDN3634875.1 transglycosylase domain-containing protein [Neolewinella lacunae]